MFALMLNVGKIYLLFNLLTNAHVRIHPNYYTQFQMFSNTLRIERNKIESIMYVFESVVVLRYYYLMTSNNLNVPVISQLLCLSL